MGFWSSIGDAATGAADWVGEQGEDLLHDGEQLVGTGVEDASHLAADGLDDVGLRSASTWVRDHGDDLADRLGASVGERNLGETDDPTLLVHGDRGKIDAAITDLGQLATAFSEVAVGLDGIDAGTWTGQGGDAFHAAWSTTPQDWRNAETACSEAASALDTYVDTLAWAQKQATDAIRQWDQAQTPAMEEAAQQVLNLAREQRNTAASHAAEALEKAADQAPALPKRFRQ